jgi:hypothetical protein
LDILQDPTRILNSDESRFQLCPNTGRAAACKGDRSVYEHDRGLAKASVTATFTFYVSGMMCPHMVIYPHERLPSDITQTVPDTALRTDVSRSLVQVYWKCFLSTSCKTYVKFPVTLIVIGCRTHPPCHPSELSSELDIILLSLHPNAVRLLQSMNVATFKQLKMEWKRAGKTGLSKILTKY